MSEVRIRRCVLRVVRRGGWSWGSRRKELVDLAKDLLPRLLAAKLSELLDHVEGDVVLRDPVRVRLSLARTGGPFSMHLERLSLDLFGALAPAVESALREASTPKPTSRTGLEPAPAPATMRVAELLSRWRGDGSLATRLELFSAEALAAWNEALFDALGRRSPAKPVAAEELAATAAALVRTDPTTRGDDAGRWRARLILAVELLTRHRGRITARALREVCDAVLPTDVGAGAGDATSTRVTSASDAEDGRADREPSAGSPSTTHRPAAGAHALPARWETSVDSILPFLTASVLARIGHLDVLGAALDAAHAEEAGPGFAVALAYKVLSPPEAGWRREASSRHAAATFAGLAEPPDQQALALAERLGVDVWGAVDASLLHALIEGHTAGDPLALLAIEGDAPDRYLLVDVEGSFPVALCENVEEVTRVVQRFGAVPLWIKEEAASPDALGALDEAGCVFVTDGRPARGERWEPLGRGRRLWSNRPSPELERRARGLRDAFERARALVRDLRIRPAVTRGAAPRLERSVSLAAGTGLGHIAWTLWREQDPAAAQPSIALARFGDLGGKVSFRSDRVVVTPALGRRSRDLREGGLLGDIGAVPWLGGRPVEFQGM